jgi:reversibly glycosylated polypeptide/UDP-arabinopyranose mutase
MRAAIVVPTVRGDCISRFLDEWRQEFDGHIVIVVEDNPEPSFDISGRDTRHFSWQDIDSELGDHAWIIPRRTDCVRSYGYYKASHEPNIDMIVTLDDDCYPQTPNFLQTHFERLRRTAVSRPWIATGTGPCPRGMPYHTVYRELPCGLNHGLWVNVPDFDAVTQLTNARAVQSFEPVNQTIPVGCYFPMCGMNLAWKPELTPAMYFLLMGQCVWPFDRFGDIWCGVCAKKICDHLGVGVTSGDPLIEHQRASNVWQNLRKEVAGYEMNESFWHLVDGIVLTKDTFRSCYAELAAKLPLRGEYWDRLRQAMLLWTELF